MPSIRLLGRQSAFNVQKILWALDELGIEFDHEDVGGSHGGLDTEEFLALNPNGRVPVLIDGGQSIWESHSILRYLGAVYGTEAFWPTSPFERSQADRWMDWCLATLQPDFMKVFWGFFRTPPEDRNARRIESALKACEAHYRLLDAHLDSRNFLAGAAFSFADVPAGTSLYRFFEMGLDVPRFSNVDAWYARLGERPAFRSNIMVSFEELRGRIGF